MEELIKLKQQLDTDCERIEKEINDSRAEIKRGLALLEEAEQILNGK